MVKKLRQHIREILIEMSWDNQPEEVRRMRSRMVQHDDDVKPAVEQDGFYPDMSNAPERKKHHYAVSQGKEIDLKHIFHAARQHLGMSEEGMLKKLNSMNSSFRNLPEWLKPMIVRYVSKNYVELY
tara:strand:+ start:1600 stop:1977 length:378 start_codon:yes stop_codon:yes gene_type:complete